ncbi:unnamed protein product [Parascedosporium putredinis]|uniref:Nucleoside phosphorylase domain-containing protein n=1 Tax=Parascedosporium putredinis TaxID=1442378 RepID=A0A9P1M8J9_9PEZI|nr:unnamed protein product [Parascedosporium putredinis]CAI7993694.1 unnamed protein product [Parascedosporium putredinis]
MASPASKVTVGWIAPMAIELTPVLAMLEERIQVSIPGDTVMYHVGKIYNHWVAVAVCPRIGTNPAATTSENLGRSFPNIKYYLVVGIAGGVPRYGVDLREQIVLGDVIVGYPEWREGGTIHYEHGVFEENGNFSHSGHTLHADSALLSAVNNLRANHDLIPGTSIPTYLHLRKSCDKICDMTRSERREDRGTRAIRTTDTPHIHYGTIGSGNALIKSSEKRDQLYKDYNILCVEMEAAGIVAGKQALVIRGICDYADSHKNKSWQRYAAATAAAYAKELLSLVPTPDIVSNPPQPPQEVSKAVNDCLKSLAFAGMDSRFIGVETATYGTLEWLVQHQAYKDWINRDQGLLWVKGKPGSGKSTLLKYAVGQLLPQTKDLVVQFFFHGRGDLLQKSPVGFLRSILHQVVSMTPTALPELISTFEKRLGQIGPHGENWEIKNEISKIPKDLDTLYQEMISGMDEESLKLIRWICFAQKPLSLEEMCWAMTIDTDSNMESIQAYQDAESIYDSKSMKAQVNELSHGLAEVSSSANHDMIQFIHQSVKDYFCENGLLELGKRWASTENAAGAAHRQLAMVCIRYLHLEEIHKPAHDKSSEYPFLEWGEMLDYDESDGDNRTPLSLAAENGHEGIVKLLLDTQNVDIDSKINSSRTPLSWAAGNGHEGIVKLLLDTQNVDIDSKCNSSRTPLSWAAENGHEGIVKLLLDTQSVDIDSKCNSSRTPLSWAAENGHEGIVKLLLDTQSVDIDSKDAEYSQTPLSWAAENGHEGIVKLLLDTQNVDIDSKDAKYSQTPLSWAAENGHEGIVKLLLDTQSVDIDSKCNSSRTPLSWAAENGHEGIVKLLLDTQSVDIDSKDAEYSQTPLSWAAENGHEGIVKLLLDTQSVDIDSKCNSSRTPLSWAAENGHEGIVKLLLDTQSVDIDSKDAEYSQTPLSWAARNGHEGIVKLLLDTQSVDIDSKDAEYGQTPLSWAAKNGHEGIVKLLLDTQNVDIDSKDAKYSQTPLSWAAENGHEGIVKLLLDTQSVDIDSKDAEYGQTPLSWAAKNGHEGIVKLLLDTQNVDIDSTDNSGRTPLSWADKNDHEGIVKLLNQRTQPYTRSAQPESFPTFRLKDQSPLGERIGRFFVGVHSAETSTKLANDPAVAKTLLTNDDRTPPLVTQVAIVPILSRLEEFSIPHAETVHARITNAYRAPPTLPRFSLGDLHPGCILAEPWSEGSRTRRVRRLLAGVRAHMLSVEDVVPAASYRAGRAFVDGLVRAYAEGADFNAPGEVEVEARFALLRETMIRHGRELINVAYGRKGNTKEPATSTGTDVPTEPRHPRRPPSITDMAPEISESFTFVELFNSETPNATSESAPSPGTPPPGPIAAETERISTALKVLNHPRNNATVPVPASTPTIHNPYPSYRASHERILASHQCYPTYRAAQRALHDDHRCFAAYRAELAVVKSSQAGCKYVCPRSRGGVAGGATVHDNADCGRCLVDLERRVVAVRRGLEMCERSLQQALAGVEREFEVCEEDYEREMEDYLLGLTPSGPGHFFSLANTSEPVFPSINPPLGCNSNAQTNTHTHRNHITPSPPQDQHREARHSKVTMSQTKRSSSIIPSLINLVSVLVQIGILIVLILLLKEIKGVQKSGGNSVRVRTADQYGVQKVEITNSRSLPVPVMFPDTQTVRVTNALIDPLRVIVS